VGESMRQAREATTACPLPQLGPAKNRNEELEIATRLIEVARIEFLRRPEPYEQQNAEDRLIDAGLRLGTSICHLYSFALAREPFMACMCARGYLEYSLRLLWAEQRRGGWRRMMSYYTKEQRDWMKKLGRIDPETQSCFDEMNSLVPLTELDEPMPNNLLDILKEVANEDTRCNIPSLYRKPELHYRQVIGMLHMHVHANPFYMPDGPVLGSTDQAAQALADGTMALLRAVGYRLAWDQKSVAATGFRICSFSLLDEDDRQGLMESINKNTDYAVGHVDPDRTELWWSI